MQFPKITKIKNDYLKKIQNGREISCAGDQKKTIFSGKLNALSNGEKRFLKAGLFEAILYIILGKNRRLESIGRLGKNRFQTRKTKVLY